MGNGTPEAVLVKSTFGNKAMDMRIPLQVTSKGMKDTDKTWDKTSLMIEIIEEPGNDLINSLKKAVEKKTVCEEERTQFFCDGKDTVAMRTANKLK